MTTPENLDMEAPEEDLTDEQIEAALEGVDTSALDAAFDRTEDAYLERLEESIASRIEE